MIRISSLVGIIFAGIFAVAFLVAAIGTKIGGFFVAAGVSALLFTICVIQFRKAKPVESLGLVDKESYQERLEFISRLNRKHAHVPLILVGILFLVHFSLYFTGHISANPTVLELYKVGGDYGYDAAHGQAWRLFSSMFLHGSFEHLILNCFGLWAAGRLLDYLVGWPSLLAIYLLGGLVGELSSAIFHPGVVGIGASGAIFAIYGALVAGLFFSQRLKTIKAPRSVFLGSAFQAMQSLSYGLSHAGVDNSAHIGGLIAGFLLLAILYLNKNDREYRLLVFSAVASLLLAFTFFALPNIIPVVHTNPVVSEENRNRIFKDLQRLDELEIEFRKEVVGSPDTLAKLQWLHDSYLPRYRELLEELRKTEVDGLHPAAVELRNTEINTMSACLPLLSTKADLSGKVEASIANLDKMAKDCQAATAERARVMQRLQTQH